MFPTLRDFVDELDRLGELVRISEPVSPLLEITEITDRVSKARCAADPGDWARHTDPRFWDRGGHALLFENVVTPGGGKSPFPVLINAFGSYSRMAIALGCARDQRGVTDGIPGGFEAIGQRIGELVKPEPPRGLREAIAKARQFAPLLKIGPKRVSTGECQQVLYSGDEADLSIIPALRCWPLDGDYHALGYPHPSKLNDPIPGITPFDEAEASGLRGRYITLAGIHTIHADDAGEKKPTSHNVGMYRVQMLGRNKLAMHWHMHHDGANHWRSWKRKRQPMPVAIALGGESVLPYAATAPLPPGISELLMAGFLRSIGGGGGIRMTRAATVPLWVPANAEIIIEGYVSEEAGVIGYDPRDPNASPLGEGAVFEGPFGDHTGFYSMPDRYPILTVTAITHRHNAIYPTTVVGLPPQEDYFLGKATERVFFPLLKTLIHDIEDYDLPMFGAFHNCAVLGVHKQYPLQGRRVMHAVWGAGQMAWTKNLFVVDAEKVDVHDTRAVFDAMARYCDPSRDIEFVNGPLDILDHAAPRLAAGTKIGFDCTPKWPGEEVNGVPVPTDAPKLEPLSGSERDDYVSRVREIRGVHHAAMPDDASGAWLFISIERPGDSSTDPVPPVLDELWSLALHADRAPRFVCIVDSSVEVTDTDEVLFHWCANSDAGRDLFWSPERKRCAFDSLPKQPGGPRDGRHGQPVREWPPILENDPEVKRRVTEQWGCYGIPLKD